MAALRRCEDQEALQTDFTSLSVALPLQSGNGRV